MAESSLNVIVVTYNSAPHIDECLRSIKEQLPGDGSRIVVFDNASADKTSELVSSRWPEVQLIRSDKNLGFGRACNEAARGAQEKYILLVNPDAILQPGCISKLFDLAHRFPGSGLYGGRNFTPDGAPRNSCYGRLTLWVMWCNSTGLSQIFYRSKWFNPQLMGGRSCNFQTEQEVGVIAGSLLLVDRKAWERLGGFDEKFFLYAEDSDLCRRAADLGYSPRVTPEARIVHIGGASSASRATGLVMLYRGEVTLIRKIWTGRRRLLAERMLLSGVLVRAVFSNARFLWTKRPGLWSEMWRRRQEWRHGYR